MDKRQNHQEEQLDGFYLVGPGALQISPTWMAILDGSFSPVLFSHHCSLIWCLFRQCQSETRKTET